MIENCTESAYNSIISEKYEMESSQRGTEFAAEWMRQWMGLKNKTLKTRFSDETLVLSRVVNIVRDRKSYIPVYNELLKFYIIRYNSVREPLGLLYRLDNCFSVVLHP